MLEAQAIADATADLIKPLAQAADVELTKPMPQEAETVPQAPPSIQAQAAVEGMKVEPQESAATAPAKRYPSISEYQKAIQETTGQPQNMTARPLYGEELSPSLISQATSTDSIAKAHFNNLGDKTPEERARTGGLFGARAGLQKNGLIGSLIGSGVGAVAARALGVIQNGEHEDNMRKDNMLTTMAQMKLLSKDGVIDFEDAGTSMLITNDPSMRLPNISSFGKGKDRSIYETDVSNPFNNRATAAARPIALYLANGLLGYKDRKNPRDENASRNAVALLTNAFLHKADSEKTIYKRARKTVEKLGLNEDKLRTYFNDNKGSFQAEEAESIRAGLDRIFR